MSIPIVRADLVARIGEAEVVKYAKAAGDGSVSDRIAEAWDSIRSAALNVFTADSFDALTVDTVPPEIRKHGVSLAIGGLVSGMNHPDYLDEAADAAKTWLSYLAAGKVHYASEVLARITTRTGGSSARVGAPRHDAFSHGRLRRRHSLT
jgi:hypothetical protein